MPGNASWNYNRRRWHGRWKVRMCNKSFCGPPCCGCIVHEAFRPDRCVSRAVPGEINIVFEVCRTCMCVRVWTWLGRDTHDGVYESYRLMLTELSRRSSNCAISRRKYSAHSRWRRRDISPGCAECLLGQFYDTICERAVNNTRHRNEVSIVTYYHKAIYVGNISDMWNNLEKLLYV